MLCYVAPCCAIYVVLFCAMLRYVLLFCAMPCYVVPCFSMLCYLALCCGMLRYVVNFFARLSYVVLCCTMNSLSGLQFDLFKLQACKAVSFSSIGEKTNKNLITLMLS